MSTTELPNTRFLQAGDVIDATLLLPQRCRVLEISPNGDVVSVQPLPSGPTGVELVDGVWIEIDN